MERKYFKCNVLGGFRLADLQRNIKQGEYFFLDLHITETSRAVQAALRNKWLVEVTEKDAMTYINTPPKPEAMLRGNTAKVIEGVSVPDVEKVNSSLESRQAKANLNVAMPDVVAVEKKRKEEQEKINKEAMFESVATPNLKAKEPKEQKAIEAVVQEQVEKPKRKYTKRKIAVEEKPTEEKFYALADESMDNSGLATPNLAEKAEEKAESQTKIDAKRRIHEKIMKKKQLKDKVEVVEV